MHKSMDYHDLLKINKVVIRYLQVFTTILSNCVLYFLKQLNLKLYSTYFTRLYYKITNAQSQ